MSRLGKPIAFLSLIYNILYLILKIDINYNKYNKYNNKKKRE
jgi:hypothetical protein